MKVLVVSLERATERRVYIRKHLDDLQLDYEIIDAVDYQQMTPEDFRTRTDEQAVAANQYLTKGVLACALSHDKIYNKMIREGLDQVMVIEDDAILPPDIKAQMDQIGRVIQPEEVITLSYFCHYGNNIVLSSRNKTRLPDGKELVYPVDLHDIGSTMAYVITRSAAEKLARITLPISVAADKWGDFHDRGGLSSFRCVYPLQVKPALFRSTLDYPDAKTWKSRIAAWVRKHKIPVLNAYLDQRSQQLIDQKYTFQFVDQPPFNAGQAKKQAVS